MNQIFFWAFCIPLVNFSDSQILVGTFSYATKKCNESGMSLFPPGIYDSNTQSWLKKKFPFGYWMNEERFTSSEKTVTIVVQRRQTAANITNLCEHISQTSTHRRDRWRKNIYRRCKNSTLDFTDILIMMENNMIEQQKEYIYNGSLASGNQRFDRKCGYIDGKARNTSFLSCQEELPFLCYDMSEKKLPLYQTISVSILNNTNATSMTSDSTVNNSVLTFDFDSGEASFDDDSSSSVVAAIIIPIVLIAVIAVVVGILLLKRYKNRENEYLDVQTRPAASEHDYAVPTLYRNVQFDPKNHQAAEHDYYNNSLNSVHYVNTETTNKKVTNPSIGTDEEPQELYDNVNQ